MSVPGGGGGGGINLPPLNQQINVGVGVNGNPSAQINGITQAVHSATTAVGGMTGSWSGMYGAVNRTIPTWRATGDALRMTGSLLQYQVAMPLKMIGSAAIKASAEFETSMKKIQGLAGIAGDQVSAMSSKVLDMAGNVGKAPQELADALYFITSAGIKDTTVAMDTLDVSARAAAAGLGTTKDIANLSTSVMNAYAPGLYSAQVATDALTAAVREGKANAADFAPAMGKVIPVAAAFGVKFQDVAAAVAALTRQGAPAGTAAIQLRQILGTLLNPTQKATDELKKYGMSAGSLRETIQQQGLLAGLQQLKNAFGGNAQALTQVFGNIRPLQAIMALIGPSFEKNASIFNELTNSVGDTNAAFEVAQQTVGQKLKEASAEGKVALIKIGDSLAPITKIFASFGKTAAEVFGFFGSFAGGILTKFAALIGGAAIAMTALTRTFATFIRMRSYTTIALQGITNGMRDQTTGMVTNITTGTSYATTMGIATTATGGLGTAAGAAATPMGALAVTMGELTAYIAELMAVMTENSAVTAENTLMMEQLIIAQGGVSTAVTTTTADVLAGNTAMAAWAGSTMTATSAATGLTGATTAAAAATGAGAAVTAGATGANLTMGQSILANIRASLTHIATQNGLTASTSIYGLTLQIVGMKLKQFGTLVAATGKSMLTTLGPMLAVIAVGYALVKLYKYMTKESSTAASKVYKNMRSLTDVASEFRSAPIVIGVDVQYTVNGGKSTTNKNDTVIDKFKKFLFNEDKDGKPSEQGKIIQTEIDGFASDVKSGVLAGERKMRVAVGLVQQFGADTKTRYAATQYFAKIFDIKDPKELEKAVTNSSNKAKDIFEANFATFTKTIAAESNSSSFAPVAGQASGIQDYFQKYVDYFMQQGAKTAKDTTIGVSGENFLGSITADIQATGGGIVGPLTDSLALAGGSSEQFVGSLESIYNSALKATKSTTFAEQATLQFAKAAFKATKANKDGATVAELMANNSDKMNSSIVGLTAGVESVTGKTNAADISVKEIIDTFNNHFKPATDGAVRNMAAISEAIGTMQAEFDQGFNPAIQDAIDMFDAYGEAMKNIKKQQDALFNSQIEFTNAQGALGTAVSDALTKIRDSGGDITSFSAKAQVAKQALGTVFKGIMDVANAAYANAAGGQEEKKTAAIQAVQAYTDAANAALIKGGVSKEALDAFWTNTMGKTITVGGEKITATADWLSKTFSGMGSSGTTTPTDLGAQAGADTASGVASGVQSKQSELEQAAMDSANGIIGAYKDKLGIKSPSQVMYDHVGTPIVQGIRKAIVDGQVDLNKAATTAATTTVSTMKATSKSAIEGFKLFSYIDPTNAASTAGNGTGDGTGNGIGTDPSNPFADAANELLTSAVAKQLKDKARKDALAKSIKLNTEKIGKGVYDALATMAGKGATSILSKKNGRTLLENYAEGVLAAQGKVKTNVTKLVKAIVSEVNDKLSTFSAVITAQLNLSGAKKDLANFMVNNTPEMLAASVAAATRAVTQSQMKYGAGQGTEVTKYERSKIGAARSAAEQAQRDYRLGKVSYADMIDAQIEYENVQKAASEASKENADATTGLNDATYQQTNSATLLAQEQMKVVDAQNGLTTAYINANTSGSDLKDTLTAIATQAGVASAGLLSVFAALAGKTPADMGLSGNMATMIGVANSEANASSLTNAPSTAVATPSGKAVLPSVKPTNPKTGAMYRNSKGVAFRWNGKSWVRVPGYAYGGNIMPGQLSMVGENGPELIRPASAMNVTPFSVLEQYARVMAHGGSNGGYGSDGKNISIVVNNPVPERASDSISRRMQNLSTLGLFG